MGMYLLSLRWREIRYAGDEIFSGVRLAPMPLFTLPVHVYWNRMANWQSTSQAKLWEAHLWARCGARHHTWTQTTRTGKFCNWPHDRCCWSEYIGCIQQTPGLLHHHDARTGNASLPANRVMQVRCITSFGLCICPRSLRFLLPPPLLLPSVSLDFENVYNTHLNPPRSEGLCHSNKILRLFAGGERATLLLSPPYWPFGNNRGQDGAFKSHPLSCQSNTFMCV